MIERAPFLLRRILSAFLMLWCIAPNGALQSGAAAQPPQEASGQPAEPAPVDPSGGTTAVIPPGHEELLAEMLGRGAALPGPCSFANGQIEADTVIASYACPTGEVVFTLRHPTKATSDATLTEQFAVAVQSGSPPAALTDELTSRIRSREGEFEWTWAGLPATREEPRLVALIIAVLLAGGVLWLVLRRRRRQAKEA